MIRHSLVVAVLTLIACSGGDPAGPTAPEGFGRVTVTLAPVAGGPSLNFSAWVQVAGGTPVRLTERETENFDNVPAGAQTVEVSSLTGLCIIEGANPRTISVAANQTTRVAFEVRCAFDGQPRIAFVRRQDRWDYDLWTVSPDGSNLAQLTFDGLSLSPTWSPDGTRIAFQIGTTVWVMNFDGSEARQLATQAGLPSWSPDGTKILFSRSIGGRPHHTWIMDADGSNERELSGGEEGETMPSWSHDGQKIVFCLGGLGLVVMERDGSNRQILANRGCSYPAWAPDDQEIAFAGMDGPVPQIYRIGPDGSALTPLTDLEGGCGMPAYSSDGSAILFNTHGGGDDAIERAWIMDRSGKNLRRFDPIPLGGVSHLRWWGR